MEKVSFAMMLVNLHKKLDDDYDLYYRAALRARALKPVVRMLIEDLERANVDFPVRLSVTSSTIYLSTDTHEHALELCRVYGKYVGFRWKREVMMFNGEKLQFTGEKDPAWDGYAFTLQISDVPLGEHCHVEYTEVQETKIVKKAKIVCSDPEKKFGDPVVITPST